MDRYDTTRKICWCWFVTCSLPSCRKKQLIKLPNGNLIGDETTINDELHELAKSHGVNFAFRECCPQLVELDLIALLEHHCVTLRLCHLKCNSSLLIRNIKRDSFTYQETPGTLSERFSHQPSYEIASSSISSSYRC